jgi:hypothetical protein
MPCPSHRPYHPMTTKEEIKRTAGNKMLVHIGLAIPCCCFDAYLSGTPWASVLVWCFGAAMLVTVGYLAAVIKMAEEFSKTK